jgi:antitoxin component YwqK of YwqJK toxin-antitoxin module
MKFSFYTLKLPLALVVSLLLTSVSMASNRNQLDQTGLKQGYWVITAEMSGDRSYPTGAKVEEGFYKDDLRDGVWKKYYPSGKLRSEITYVLGKPHGYYVTFYSNGGIEEQGNWIDEKNVGEFKRYYENGKVHQHFYFNEQGKRHGIQYYFHENGNPALVVDIKNGIESGLQKRFNPDGTLAEEKIFEHGKVKAGSTKTYKQPKAIEPKADPNNPEIGREVSADRSKFKTNPAIPFEQNGYNTLYDVNGNITQSGEFKNGKLYNGKWYRYNSSGVLVKIDLFRKGKYIGTGTSEDEN